MEIRGCVPGASSFFEVGQSNVIRSACHPADWPMQCENSRPHLECGYSFAVFSKITCPIRDCDKRSG